MRAKIQLVREGANKFSNEKLTGDVEGVLGVGVFVRRHDDLDGVLDDGQRSAVDEVGKVDKLLREGCDVATGRKAHANGRKRSQGSARATSSRTALSAVCGNF
jgi:hypothetical protein